MFGLFGKNKSKEAKRLISELREYLKEDEVLDAIISAELNGMVSWQVKDKFDKVNELSQAIADEMGITPSEVGQMMQKWL